MSAAEADNPSETKPARRPKGYGPQGLSPLLAWYSVVMIALVSVFAQIDRFIITLLLTPIKRDLVLTDTQLSLLVGLAFSLSYAGASLPLSRLADTWSRKQVLTCALAAWSAATAACGLARDFVHFFIIRMIVGGCEGVKSPCSTSMIADLVPENRLARAYAIFNLATNSGAALALLIGGALLAVLAHAPEISVPGLGVLREWQLIFLIIGPPGALFALWLWLTLPEPARTRARRRESAPVSQVLALITDPGKVVAPMLVISTLNYIQAGGLTAWRPTFFERTYGWSAEATGSLLGSTYLLACAIAFPVGAWIAEWFAKRYEDAFLRVVLIGQILATPLMALSPFAPSGAVALTMITIATTLTLSATPSLLAAFQVATPEPMRSQVSAIFFMTLNVVGVAGGPFVVALLTDSVFRDERLLRYSLVALVVLFAPASLFLNWRMLKPYARRCSAMRTQGADAQN